MSTRILYICHNHPSLHPGGSEIFAHDLFREVKRRRGVDALFLACTNRLHRRRHPGTSFQSVGNAADELLLWAGHFDRFNHSQIDLHGIVPDLRRLLEDYRPDAVHFHHSLLIGVEALQLVKRVLPAARIVFTLHDYYLICHNDGLMVKTDTGALCREASPDACHRCFPKQRADAFLARELHVKNFLRLVDAFVAPSEHLRRCFLHWGLPESKVIAIPNARPAPGALALDEPGRNLRCEFGYFGNVSPAKGVLVALQAVRGLMRDGRRDFTLHIHGDTLFQSEAFETSFRDLLNETAPCTIHHGGYVRGSASQLMQGVGWVIMPSVWWENAPLVIQEAFQARRPVICSNIGGMAEAVRDQIDGLHFRSGDCADLMRIMAQAMDQPELWEHLRTGITEPPRMADIAKRHLALYRPGSAPRPRARTAKRKV